MAQRHVAELGRDSDRHQDSGEHPAGTGGGVDPVVDRAHGNPALGEVVQGVDDRAHVAAESVESPHDQGVAGAQIVEALGESGPVIAGTGHHVVEDAARPGGGQLFGLLLQGLSQGRHPGVADDGGRGGGGGGGHEPFKPKVSD